MTEKSKKLLTDVLVVLLWLPIVFFIVAPLLVNHLTIPALKVLGIYFGAGLIKFLFLEAAIAPIWLSALTKKDYRKVTRATLILLTFSAAIVPLIIFNYLYLYFCHRLHQPLYSSDREKTGRKLWCQGSLR